MGEQHPVEEPAPVPFPAADQYTSRGTALGVLEEDFYFPPVENFSLCVFWLIKKYQIRWKRRSSALPTHPDERNGVWGGTLIFWAPGAQRSFLPEFLLESLRQSSVAY